jgi:fermentation-respiration switch protein FrsA (DUF1100 family)
MDDGLYIPRVLATVKLHFVDKFRDLDHWQTMTLAAPLSDDGSAALWDEADPCDRATLHTEPTSGIGFADLPAGALRAANYTGYGKTLAEWLYQSQRLTLYRCEPLKLTSDPNESEGNFRARLAHLLRERRDTQKEALRKKYALKLESTHNAVERADDRVRREQAQAAQRKFDTVISVGATVLGALFGRKLISVGSVGRAETAARRAARIGQSSGQIERATEGREQLQQRHDDLARELADELAVLDRGLDAQTIELTLETIAPRKLDIAVTPVQLLWISTDEENS